MAGRRRSRKRPGAAGSAERRAFAGGGFPAGTGIPAYNMLEVDVDMPERMTDEDEYDDEEESAVTS